VSKRNYNWVNMRLHASVGGAVRMSDATHTDVT